MISVGIDVSKGKSTVCIMKPGSEVLQTPIDILHTMESVLALANRLKSYNDEVRVVLEDTGHYHWPVVTLLTENGVFVCCVNALRMKKFCSQSIRKAKTDKIDAIKIAQFGLTYWDELIPVMPEKDAFDELRTFSRQYYQYVGLLTKAKINLSNLLDRTMPGIGDILKDINDNHKLTNFVERYWHFDHICKMGERKFTSDYCKWAEKKGYRKNECKAKQIFTLSQNGIPVLPCTASTKLLIQETARILKEVEKSRNAILTRMKEIASDLPEFSILTTMHGVGPVLASRFIAEVGAIHRFHNRNALIAYAGIDTPPYQSGAFCATERKISKRGNKYLRRTGFEIMQSIMRQKPTEDSAVYEFMLKKQSEGKAPKHSKIAGLNKFLKIYYARTLQVYREIEDELIFNSAI